MSRQQPPGRRQRIARRMLACVLAGALACVWAPASAHAQFGKLKEVVKKQVTGKDAEKKPAEPTQPDPASQLTLDRLDQFFAAVDPWLTKVDAYRGEMQKVKDYEASTDRYNECRQRVISSPAVAVPSNMDMKEIERLNELLGQLTERSGRAHMSGDTALARVLTDSTTRVIRQMEHAQFPALKQCGTPPAEPPKPRAPGFEIPDEARRTFTRNQLGYLRERLLLYSIWKAAGKRDAIDRAFQPDEVEALDTRRGQLDRFTVAMNATNASWRTWHDLAIW